MTDPKGRHRFWRRGRRRKEEGASPQAGAGDAQGLAGHQEGDGAPAPVEEPQSRDEGEAAVPPELLAAADAIAAGPSGAPKKGRRRGRRRGGGRAAGDAGAAPAAEAGAEEPGREAGPAPAGAAWPFPFPEPEGSSPPVGAAGVPTGGEPAGRAEGEAPGPPEAGEEGETRRKSRRRRRRRRGRRPEEAAPEQAAAKAEEETPAGGPSRESYEEPWTEFPAGAEGTEVVEGGGEEEEEEEREPDRDAGGKGPRRVMAIDGVHPEEIRVVIVREGILDYYEVENQRRKLFKGNIYKGRVVNVAPAIEAAFVEFGGGRHGFLPLNEYCAGALIDRLDRWNEGEKRPPLRPGTEIVVQVTKEESSIKGAALTSYISIAGRYLVMMLGMKRYGISKKIVSEKERERIRKNMEKLDYPEHLGFIVRTVGAGQPVKDLKADLKNLLKLWDRTVEGARSRKAPALLYEEQDIVVRALRDNYSDDIAEVFIDSADSYRKAQDFFDVYYPGQKAKLKLYRQKRPLFSKFNLEEQLERGCARKVPLPSGGHIVIDRTEALWSVDVNSGRSARDRDIEDTAHRTNREAAVETARQMRIRDMGGLIVIDFIDMENRQHIKDVEKALKEEMKRDKAKFDISAMGKFGLVAISRQRMGISFYDVQMEGCDVCAGTGLLATPDATVVRILRKVHEDLSREPGREEVLRVPPRLLETLLNHKRDEISRIEKLCGGRVTFVADPSLGPREFASGGGAT